MKHLAMASLLLLSVVALAAPNPSDYKHQRSCERDSNGA
jgi:hypothetical protein